MTKKNPHAVALGKRGGSIKSPAKTSSSRANGLKGGAPPRYRLNALNGLERRTGGVWYVLAPPYDANAKAWLRGSLKSR